MSPKERVQAVVAAINPLIYDLVTEERNVSGKEIAEAAIAAADATRAKLEVTDDAMDAACMAFGVHCGDVFTGDCEGCKRGLKDAIEAAFKVME